MKTKIVEVTNGPNNWGKFLIGQLDTEWQRMSALPDVPDDPLITKLPLLRLIAMNPRAVLVLDLQTCEGALFMPGGFAQADLNKHRIWVCPMFEPFLEWLYPFTRCRTGWFDDLPQHVDLPDAPFAMAGYRREGP